MSSINNSSNDVNIHQRIMSQSGILFDLVVMGVNICLDWCYIAGFGEYMLTLGLNSQMVGQLFLLRAVVYVLSCIIVPYFNIPPKL